MPLHPALAGALPRAGAEDERLFKLLKRAYIEARYSKSYRITAEELSILSDRVRDLGVRVRRACVERLASYCGPDAVGELPPEPPAAEVGELPAAPSLEDAQALERWRDAIVEQSFERGEMLRRDGLREGLREGQARAIVDVLRRRGVAVSDAEAGRILACRDDVVLARWWENALFAASAADLLGETGG